jgi:hypothetical protein
VLVLVDVAVGVLVNVSVGEGVLVFVGGTGVFVGDMATLVKNCTLSTCMSSAPLELLCH